MINFILKIYTCLFVLFFFLLPNGFANKKEQYVLNDLSFFNSSSRSWSMVGSVSTSPSDLTKFVTTQGGQILINQPTKKNKGEDLFTKQEFGDIELSLLFMMPEGSNSGVYLQGRYEVQLEDSWSSQNVTSSSSGGIYNQQAPRFSVSKAPGLWQSLKIVFRAPRLDQSGAKVENARLKSVELNGVLIQEDVELPHPTPGAVSEKEVAKAALRFQGDHGAVAFKDIKVVEIEEEETKEDSRYAADPIWVDGKTTPLLRSFMDIPGNKRVTHAVSVASPYNLHYTYDLNSGAVLQIWRGGFLDATPMWDGRGNGTSRPLGTVQSLSTQQLQVAKLDVEKDSWPQKLDESLFKSKGYQIDRMNIPTFQYEIEGVKISDRSEVVNDGRRLQRTIEVDQEKEDLFVLIAEADEIEALPKGEYVIGDRAYYILLDNVKDLKPFVRENNGKKQLLAPLSKTLTYSIIL